VVRLRWSTQTKSRAELALLVAISYLPILASSPGRVSADSKQALYVDAGRFLGGADSLWDPAVGAGTVPHQHLGYLWPMGPWFWFFDQVGVPVWVAQRLWIGTLVLLAALGARWFLRSMGLGVGPALVGAMVYALTPYQLAFTARMSVVLLPWVGLPWMVELARRAVRHGGWRHPALFALVLVTASGVNATALLLAGVGPLVLLAWMAASGRGRATLAATSKLAVLSIGVSAWWLAGLRAQGGYGMPVLQLTENLSDIARWSQPGEVLRGLGNWFFAGRDRLGYSLDQAETFLESPWAIALTLAAPMLALAAMVLLQGRVRVLAVTWVVVGTVVGVGSWPLDRPSPYGRAFRWLTEETSAGLAMRNSHRVVPVIVLGSALALAVVADRLPRPAWRTAGVWVVGVAAVAAMAPSVSTGLLSRNLDRPETIPDHWQVAADVLDGRGTDVHGNPLRVLEIPGSPFAAYRWGNTVEPVLPALIDRPHLAREVLPYGSEATANLLDAFDRRMQEGVFEVETLSPIARLFAAADVAVRNDLQWERYAAPQPEWLWQQLVDPSPPGVGPVDRIGEPVTDPPDPVLAPLGERDLAGGGAGAPPPPAVGLLHVDEVAGVLRLVAPDAPLVVAGDGEGLVDLAAAGLLDGRGLVHYADALDDDQLATALDDDAWLVVTDSNRRRIQTWFYAIRDVRGPTERAGETLAEPTGYDRRLDVFPQAGDRSRTVVEHLGAQAEATSSGGAARPEDRAMAAFDRDLGTAWRVGGADPTGHRLMLTLDEPAVLSEIVLVQPQDGPRDRWIEEIRLRLDDSEPLTVALDATSLDGDGQAIPFDRRSVRRLEIELTGVSVPPFDPSLANAVGFAEVVVPGVEPAETVVLPPSLLDRAGARSADHGLDFVLTRLRYDPFARGRTDAERRLDRTLEVATPRGFSLAGRARLNPDAPDEVLDRLLGTLVDGGRIRPSASSRLSGDVSSRASAAFDDDPDTGWTAAFGPQEGQWFEVSFDDPTALGRVVLTWSDDERHSTPHTVLVEIDGSLVDEATAEPGADGVRQVVLSIDQPAVSRLRLVVAEIDRRSAPAGDPAPFATLPVSLRHVDLGFPAVVSPAERIDTGCRDDLLTVDGSPLPLRIAGPSDTARAGLALEACTALELEGRTHRLLARPGWQTGVDLDRIVLSSAPGGAPTQIGARDVRSIASVAPLTDVEPGSTSWRARLDSDGDPVWLVLAQSHNAGWTAVVDGMDLGAPRLVGGFANGWLLGPHDAGSVVVELRWAPQRTVSWGIGLSTFVVGLCIGLAFGTDRRAARAELAPQDRLVLEWPGVTVTPVPPARVAAGVASVVTLMLLVGRPWVAVVAGAATVAVALLPLATTVVAVSAPAALAVALLGDRHVFGWLAVGLVLAAVAGQVAAAGISPQRRAARRPAATGSRAPRPSAPESARRHRGPES
jgi:arabinofuranan 3-O-arabinosyltransferase